MFDASHLSAPWSLRLEQDGTEDIAFILNADGEELARSRRFRLPEGGDPVPLALAAMQMMVTAPDLYDALTGMLGRHIDIDVVSGIKVSRVEDVATVNALRALAKACVDESWRFL